jgi:hypothetical protein
MPVQLHCIASNPGRTLPDWQGRWLAAWLHLSLTELQHRHGQKWRSGLQYQVYKHVKWRNGLRRQQHVDPRGYHSITASQSSQHHSITASQSLRQSQYHSIIVTQAVTVSQHHSQEHCTGLLCEAGRRTQVEDGRIPSSETTAGRGHLAHHEPAPEAASAAPSAGHSTRAFRCSCAAPCLNY